MKLVREQKLFNGDKDFSAFYASLIECGNRYQAIYTEPADGNKIGNIMAVEVDPVSLKAGTLKVLAAEIRKHFFVCFSRTCVLLFCCLHTV